MRRTPDQRINSAYPSEMEQLPPMGFENACGVLTCGKSGIPIGKTTMDNQQQSCRTECVYCTKVRPDIGADCPQCRGQRVYNQPAQMMAGRMSRQHVLESLFRGAEKMEALQNAAADSQPEKARILRDYMLGLLQSMSIYNFDLEAAVVEMILDLERDFTSDGNKA